MTTTLAQDLDQMVADLRVAREWHAAIAAAPNFAAAQEIMEEALRSGVSFAALSAVQDAA